MEKIPKTKDRKHEVIFFDRKDSYGLFFDIESALCARYAYELFIKIPNEQPKDFIKFYNEMGSKGGILNHYNEPTDPRGFMKNITKPFKIKNFKITEEQIDGEKIAFLDEVLQPYKIPTILTSKEPFVSHYFHNFRNYLLGGISMNIELGPFNSGIREHYKIKEDQTMKDLVEMEKKLQKIIVLSSYGIKDPIESDRRNKGRFTLDEIFDENFQEKMKLVTQGMILHELMKVRLSTLPFEKTTKVGSHRYFSNEILKYAWKGYKIRGGKYDSPTGNKQYVFLTEKMAKKIINSAEALFEEYLSEMK